MVNNHPKGLVLELTTPPAIAPDIDCVDEEEEEEDEDEDGDEENEDEEEADVGVEDETLLELLEPPLDLSGYVARARTDLLTDLLVDRKTTSLKSQY